MLQSLAVGRETVAHQQVAVAELVSRVRYAGLDSSCSPGQLCCLGCFCFWLCCTSRSGSVIYSGFAVAVDSQGRAWMFPMCNKLQLLTHSRAVFQSCCGEFRAYLRCSWHCSWSALHRRRIEFCFALTENMVYSRSCPVNCRTEHKLWLSDTIILI